MLRILEQIHTELMTPASVSDDTLAVDHRTAKVLNDTLAQGDHVYLKITDRRAYEVVKYTHNTPVTIGGKYSNIAVDRAQQGTVRKAWGVGTCLHTSYSEASILEFIVQHSGAV